MRNWPTEPPESDETDPHDGPPDRIVGATGTRHSRMFKSTAVAREQEGSAEDTKFPPQGLSSTGLSLGVWTWWGSTAG
jgi:hypothetical protein